MAEINNKTTESVEKTATTAGNFIKEIIENDLANGKHTAIATRFPPEPNGYLHIGHAKSICLNFGLAKQFNGHCNLRFDDTNPEKEDVEYVDSIQSDVKWLGFDWGDNLFYASSYFQQLYEWAVKMIKDGTAFVCCQTLEEMRRDRGTAKGAGIESPWRNRSIEENLDLFERMKNGEFKENEYMLRAKIDMSHPNVLMRDPVMYRIRFVEHHNTGNEWCIYPTYDYTHGLSDAIEGITHSICTLEFESHRPLYEWYLEAVGTKARPQQIEFARLNLTNTVMSKRLLLKLVKEGFVSGWDDPRMPTIAGIRRRGYTPEAIRDFAERIGVAKRESVVSINLLEHCVREDLNKKASRFMGVIDPLKVVITNYPDDLVEEFEAVNNPEDESSGTRKVPFSNVLYIEKDDFLENPMAKFHRLAPGKEVRLRAAYYITCTNVIKDNEGKITEVHCTYDPQTKGGWSADGRKVKGTIHWVSAKHAVPIEVRLYEHLFNAEDPMVCEEGKTFLDHMNPDSLKVVENACAEINIKNLKTGDRFQFERIGYFCIDPDTKKEKIVINRIVTLKDKWAKIQKSEE
ncbi:MAG TPA: glutamine--tRNA ligase/YqeY domain fusion protein [bacterium]|nr:glutamine--tRNA ligase/YqeY domain fusion protein [bacterium]HPS28676.1 glutamine--tRNA ligase/YqeY domain fusion protein [bacterium]